MANFKLRGNGRVQITIAHGLNFDGTTRRYYKEVDYVSKKQLEIDAALFLAEIIQGKSPLAESSTIDTLFTRFVADHCSNEMLSESTVGRYKQMYANQIEPYFATKRINKLSRVDVRDWIKELLKHGRKGRKPLARKTVKSCLSLLSSMYSFAISELDFESNPCEGIKVPKKVVEDNGEEFIAITSKKKDFYNDQEIMELIRLLLPELEKPTDITHATMILLILFTGIRTGEAMGLKWGDVDFESNTINIERERIYISNSGIVERPPKTDKSVRLISVPEFVMSLLKDLRAFQSDSKDKMGDDYQYTNYVAVTACGTPQHPRNMYKWFQRFLKVHDLKPATVHDLRHTHVAILSSLGIKIIDVSKRLGHANSRITAEVYEYLFKDIDDSISAELNDKFKNYVKATSKKKPTS